MDDNLEQALQLDVRKKLYNTISRNPGLHFRELQRRVGIATGALQYHLDYLAKKHLVRAEKETKFMRYYLVRQDFRETDLMSLLRQESMRKIIVFLMQRRFANNNAISAGVSLSPSTTSWHLDKLSESGYIERWRRGKRTYYKVVDKDRIASLLVGYRRSFLDEVVNNFVEVWEEM
ncbi:MAG: winged helix-turn-helix transcriptional regulator [Candidatus Diapherotrites archaeon]|uniref:Winged helix-turn-helix transcriptional regulator n=1 Tax=Candidatus Iainarchaeum sp. TaxID=3101447 RepID=A0A8T3YQ47_9ARCH|nr:winged helix-turn-helix transcriptional regulator [Candidatus Diapherotrites archaeon]